MSPLSPHTILILVANPVDILTHFARKLSGLPSSQVLGTGTSLDTARLRGALADSLSISPSSINAFVLGEHGDSQFIPWSTATIGCTPLHLALPSGTLTSEFKAEVEERTRGAAGAIIKAKGCTAYGIGNVAAGICRAVLFDSRVVRAVSFWQEELGCCLSMPGVVGRQGVVRGMEVEFDEGERRALEECAGGLRRVIEGAEKEMEADEELRKVLERGN
jgi:L-lactate dehydrogenase